jgi:hypothetical protein
MSAQKSGPYFDPKARAAEKAASRREDMRALEAGEITKAELARRNSFFGALDIRKARILNRPEIKIEV